MPDLGNGNYKNPILYADYTDPDVIRVSADFYMIASSFNAMPGIPDSEGFSDFEWFRIE